MYSCYFKEAIFHLEDGKTIKSAISGREVKRVGEDYYWRRDIEGSKYREWRICKLDEGLFTSGEVQCSWEVIDLE